MSDTQAPSRHQHRAPIRIIILLAIGVGVLACAGIIGVVALTLLVFLATTL